MNTLALDHVNKRAEFVMSFTIPFKAVEDPTSQAKCYSPHEVIMAWREVCIKALRMRIDACMEMLFRNKDKPYRKPIPIYKFGDNLKESDSLERQALYSLLIIQIQYQRAVD